MTMTTPESRAAHRAESPVLAGVPEGLQPADLDRLVGTFDGSSQDVSAEDIKARIDEELRAHGFDPDAEDAQALEDYNFARGIYETVLSQNKDSWLGLPEGRQLNRRELVADAIAEWYEPRLIHSRYEGRHRAETQGEQPAVVTSDHEQADRTNETPSSTEVSEEDGSADIPSEDVVADIEEKKDALLDTYAELIAIRSRSIVERTKTGQDIEAAGNELSGYIAALADNMYRDLEDAGLEHDAIVAKVDEFIDQVTNDTLAKVEAHRLAEYNNSRPYLQKMYDKWADWSADNRKLTGGRLKKSLAFALPGAALGLALGPLVGAVGVGVLTGAAAVAGSRSIGRHLANGFMKKRDKRFAQAQTEEMRTEIDSVYAQNQAAYKARNDAPANGRILPRPKERNLDLIEFVNQRSHEYRVRNRNRVLAGTAIAMSVGLLSSTAAEMLNGSIELHNPFGGHETNPGTGTANTPTAPAVPPEQLKTPGETLLPTHQLDWHDFNHEARIVEPGEGGFQTLKEMGVPENKWEAIWQDAGTKLHAEGKTYTMNDGRWGWDRAMRLSDKDLNVIAKAAERHGVTLS